MICPDCANGADLAATAQALMPADLAAIVEANHDLCRLRNLDREFGQLADCTCQHAPAATAGATPRS